MAIPLSIDVSDALRLANALKNGLSQSQINSMMTKAYRDTGRHVKTILKRDLPKHYDTTVSHVAKQVGKPVMENENTPLAGCTIPISGARQLHGPHNKLYMWKPGRPVRVQIVKGKKSTLPGTIPHQGGNAPFVAVGKGVRTVFTRRTENRYPIVRVPGVSVPQMPMNEALDDVQDDIGNFLQKRIQHYHDVIIKGIVK